MVKGDTEGPTVALTKASGMGSTMARAGRLREMQRRADQARKQYEEARTATLHAKVKLPKCEEAEMGPGQVGLRSWVFRRG